VALLSSRTSVCRVKALSCSCERHTFPTPTLKRLELEFDKQFVHECRRFVVHSDRYLGGNAARHDAIALSPLSVAVSDFWLTPSARSNNRKSAADRQFTQCPETPYRWRRRSASTRIGPSAVDILGSGELEGSGRFIVSALAKVDQIPVDDQSLFIRQIVEIGRVMRSFELSAAYG
jgi:hypothetical protein